MGIFNRINTLFKSNVNDMISKAEDPEKMVNQMIIDMSEQYSKAKSEVANTVAEEKKLKRSLEEQEAKVKEWTRKAELAVEKGDDQLALVALGKKNEFQSLADQFRTQYEVQKQANNKLKASLKDLADKIEEAKRKKSLIIAKSKRAEAQQAIQKTMSSLSDKSAYDTFARMEEKANDLENRALAELELNDMLGDTELEDQFSKLEDEGVNDELAALKAKLGKA